jgi:hypothetical protein
VTGAQQILDAGVNQNNFFPPLHFLFLAGGLYLGEGSFFYPALANVLVGWLTVLAIYLLAKNLYGERVALIALILAGFYPNFILYELALFPEMLTLFWIVFSFLMIERYFKTSRIHYLLIAAITWGIASQIRAGLHLFSLFIAFTIAITIVRKTPIQLVKTVGIFLVTTYSTIYIIGLLVLPIHGELALNSKNGVASALLGVNRMAVGCTDYGHTRGNMYYRINPINEWPENAHLSPEELLQSKLWSIALRTVVFVSQQPITYIKNSFIKLSCLWSPNQAVIKYLKRVHFKEMKGPLANVICMGIGIIYMCIVCGGLSGIAIAKGPFRLLFILFIIFYNIIVFLTVGNSKLRLSMMPFFIVFCALSISCIIDKTFWKQLFAHKWTIVLIVLFIGNGIYKSREFLPTPAEVRVRAIEFCTEHEFFETALSLRNNNNKFTFSWSQKKRLKVAEQNALAELYVRKIEDLNKFKYYNKILYYLNNPAQYPFSKNQKARMDGVKEIALARFQANREKQLAFSPLPDEVHQEDLPKASLPLYYWLETEDANLITHPTRVAYDQYASNGKYIEIPNGTGNHYSPGPIMAVYFVRIARSGDYLLWGRVRAQNTRDNTFFVQIDNGIDNLWEVEAGEQWHWDEINHRSAIDPVIFPLTKGVHAIKIKVREDGTQIDKLLLTNNIDFVPNGKNYTIENEDLAKNY